jgi:hypothetical protein
MPLALSYSLPLPFFTMPTPVSPQADSPPALHGHATSSRNPRRRHPQHRVMAPRSQRHPSPALRLHILPHSRARPLAPHGGAQIHLAAGAPWWLAHACWWSWLSPRASGRGRSRPCNAHTSVVVAAHAPAAPTP